MRIDETSLALRLASDAMDTAREAAEYLANPPPDGRFGIALEWSWGRSHDNAYAAIKSRVCRMVNEQMDEFVRRAVLELLDAADEKKRIAARALNS